MQTNANEPSRELQILGQLNCRGLIAVKIVLKKTEVSYVSDNSLLRFVGPGKRIRMMIGLKKSAAIQALTDYLKFEVEVDSIVNTLYTIILLILSRGYHMSDRCALPNFKPGPRKNSAPTKRRSTTRFRDLNSASSSASATLVSMAGTTTRRPLLYLVTMFSLCFSNFFSNCWLIVGKL